MQAILSAEDKRFFQHSGFDPLRVIRFVVGPNEHDLTADLVFRARTVAIEEPRQTIERDAKLLMDYTRFTTWGTWEGEVRVAERYHPALGLNYGLTDLSGRFY